MREPKTQVIRPKSFRSVFFEKNKITLLFFVLVLIFYGNSLKNKYNLDDEAVTAQNPLIKKGIKAIPEIFSTPYINDGKNVFGYRPTIKASFAFEYSLFGENLFYSHLINVLLYGLACCILFRVLLLLFGEQSSLFALLTSILFLAHPLHTEVVCSLKNREVLFSFIGSLTALLFYLRYATSGKWIYILPGMLAILFAEYSKEDSRVFGLIIPFALFYFKKTDWKGTLLVLASLVLITLSGDAIHRLLVGDVHDTRVFQYYENPLLFGKDKSYFPAMAFYTAFFYLRLLLVPYPLISFYGYNAIPIVGFNDWRVIVSIVIIVALLLFCFIQFRRRSMLVFGILFYFLGISVFLNNIYPVAGIIGERHAFIASVGFCIVVMTGFYRLFNLNFSSTTYRSPLVFLKENKSAGNTLLVVLFIFWGITVNRNSDWKDIYTLTQTDIVKAPNSAYLNMMAGGAAMNKYRDQRTADSEKPQLLNQSITDYRAALIIYPHFPAALNNLGIIEASVLGNYTDATSYFIKAIACDSLNVEYYANAAASCSMQKKYDEALSLYTKALAIDPGYKKLYASLSDTYVAMGKLDEAIKLNRTIISSKMMANDYKTHMMLGDIYLLKGDTADAVDAYAGALLIDHTDINLCRKVIAYYEYKGSKGQALVFQNLIK